MTPAQPELAPQVEEPKVPKEPRDPGDPKVAKGPWFAPPEDAPERSRFRRHFLEMLGRNDTPEKIAASFALGVAISFSPFFGFHWIIALTLAILLGLNKLDVLLGTLVVNPLTLGPVSAVALPIGRFILKARREAVAHLPWNDFFSAGFWRQAGPRMRTVGIQWGVGMFVLSALMGALTYFVILRVLKMRRDRATAAETPRGR